MIICVIILVLVIVAAIILPKFLRTESATRITTYQVEEISYGNVSTTVSGSGTLTPVTQETLTSTYAGEIESVNFSVGAEVAEGDGDNILLDKQGVAVNLSGIPCRRTGCAHIQCLFDGSSGISYDVNIKF